VIMEVTAAVLYGGALAHYEVSIENNGICKARLAEYKGNPENHPPEQVVLKKEGRHWISKDGNRELSEDIGYAVELKVPRQMIINSDRRRGGMHPAA